MIKIIRLSLIAAALTLVAVPSQAQAPDTFKHAGDNLISPARHAFSVTPHDTDELTVITRAIYAGSVAACTMVVVTHSDETVTFVGLIAGLIYPFRVKIIKSTGTTCDNIVGIY